MTFSNKQLSRVFLSLLTALCLLGWNAHAQESVGIPLGIAAPQIEIEDVEGNTVTLTDHWGSQAVVIEFWATWCDSCEELQPSMDSAYEAHGDSVAFVAIAVGVGQSRRAVRRFIERHSPGYQYLFDADGAAVRAFQAPTTSFVVIVDPSGSVAYTGVGGDQDIKAELEKVLGGS